MGTKQEKTAWTAWTDRKKFRFGCFAHFNDIKLAKWSYVALKSFKNDRLKTCKLSHSLPLLTPSSLTLLLSFFSSSFLHCFIFPISLLAFPFLSFFPYSFLTLSPTYRHPRSHYTGLMVPQRRVLSICLLKPMLQQRHNRHDRNSKTIKL